MTVNPSTESVVIVGGGTAGWITAAVLAAGVRTPGGRELDITLIESPDVPTIGVGEGTWPSMRSTLRAVGISEVDLIRQCDASLKQGTEFRGWSLPGDEHWYVHPFSPPIELDGVPPVDAWLAYASDRSFAEVAAPQIELVRAGRAAKHLTTPEYGFAVNYGYHFDAGKFAELLRRHAVQKLGVRHVKANVNDLVTDDDGFIVSVVLDDGLPLDGDLFVDCTGQRSLLLGGHFGVGLESVRDILFNNCARVVQLPHATGQEPIASATRSTATAAGWIWDIGLQTRRGIGHVYSTDHVSDSSAHAELERYIRRESPGADTSRLAFRTIRFDPGYRSSFWVKNCVAVGLSAGFVEPLEASALALIEQSAAMLRQDFPVDRDRTTIAARRFNRKMRYHWERIVDFLKLHYVLSQRDDSEYWRDCCEPGSCPESLLERLALWEQQAPSYDDAPRIDELFPATSYQYVLYGMGFRPSLNRPRVATDDALAQIDQRLHAANERVRTLLQSLPSNRDWLNAVTGLPGVA